jgi:hypothetical protein
LSSSTTLLSKDLIFDHEIIPQLDFRTFQQIEDVILAGLSNSSSETTFINKKKSFTASNSHKKIIKYDHIVESPDKEKTRLISPMSTKHKPSPIKPSLSSNKLSKQQNTERKKYH